MLAGKKLSLGSLAGILLIGDSSVADFHFFRLAKAARRMRWAGESVSGSRILPAFRVRQLQSRGQTDLLDVSKLRLSTLLYVSSSIFQICNHRMREVFHVTSHNTVMFFYSIFYWRLTGVINLIIAMYVDFIILS